VPRTLSLGRHDFGTLPLPKDNRVSPPEAWSAGGPQAAEAAGLDQPSAYAAFTLEQLASSPAARSARGEPVDQHTAATAASSGGSAQERSEAPHRPELQWEPAEAAPALDDMVQQLQRDLEDAKARLRDRRATETS